MSRQTALARRDAASPWAALGAFLLGAVAASGCAQEEPNLLSARRAVSRSELVGGPVAYGDVGDFVLENDKVRAVILDTGRSWGPGLFGGSLVDLDIRRRDGRYPEGHGRDRFAEVFPLANLLVPAPTGSEISVVRDGKDGAEAAIRVEGNGYAMLHSLYALRDNLEVLNAIGFKDVKTDVRFQTDYIVRPGEQFVRMVTRVILKDPPAEGDACTDKKPCAAGRTCTKAAAADIVGRCACPELDCPGPCLARQRDAAGCDTCTCSDVVPLAVTRGNEGVIDVILGDSLPVTKKTERSGGIGGGDFLFFGKHNKQFVPNFGFDQEESTWTAWFDGRDTFAKPFVFDYVAAVGGDVSYAYYTIKRNASDPDPKVGVPVFTSTATPFVAATLNCKQDASDDESCDRQRVFEYERFLTVGRGDAADVLSVMYGHRGMATGRIEGVVLWGQTYGGAENATVFVMRDPDPSREFATIDEVAAANRAIDGSPGVVSAIDADPGVDEIEDGDYASVLPVGDYLLVPRDAQAIVFGKPVRVHVGADERKVVALTLPTPSRLRVRITDASGQALPAKITVQALSATGEVVEGDANRRVFAGQGRIGSGVEAIAFASDGEADVPLAPGRYRVIASHGPEYSLFRLEDVTLIEGQQLPISAALVHEVDSKGWISSDFHLHQRPSFDSGMALDQRVRTIVAEGVDYAAATDHDVVTDFGPIIRSLGLDDWLKSVIGVEVSTLDVGHYIGFPFKYKELDVPSHGSVDWYCMPSDDLVQAMAFERSGFEAASDRATTIVAHPRDGFLGWADQIDLNPYTLTRMRDGNEKEEGRAVDTAVFRTTTCDFDTLEVLNGKRFDLIHTPTVREIHVYERCLTRIDNAGRDAALATTDPAKARAALATACPELAALPELQETPEFLPLDVAGRLADCSDSEPIATCKMRHRRALAVAVNTAMLVRRPEEQQAWLVELQRTPDEKAKWQKSEGADAAAAAVMLEDLTKLCRFDPKKLSQPIENVIAPGDVDRPCGERNGALADWMRMLEYGLVKTASGGSDSHDGSLEPGTPRNYIRSAGDTPLTIDPAAIARNLRAGHAVTSYGPLIEASVGGKGPGEVAAVGGDGKVQLRVRVQTASWYGIDLIEVYVNGEVAARKTLDVDPKAIVDFDGAFELDAPAGRDSWVAVVAMGRGKRHWMRPISLDVPFGELQLPRVASMAFSNIPLVSAVFPAPVRFPDFYPVRPYAIANAILLDRGGDGAYNAPLGPPPFCSPACDPATGKLASGSGTCQSLQLDFVCLASEKRCGVPIPTVCDVYQALSGGALRDALGAHGK